MLINIELNDKLVKEAFLYASVTTKSGLIDIALREFVENHKCNDICKLRHFFTFVIPRLARGIQARSLF